MTLRSLPAGIALVAAFLLPAAGARALSFSPDPFTVGPPTLDPFATVDVLSADLGLPAGAVQLVGATGAGDLTVVFTLDVAATSLLAYDGVMAQASTADLDPLPVTGAGILASSGLAPDAAHISASGNSARFQYPDDAVTVGAGLATFFVSFASLAPGDVFYAGMNTVVPPLPGAGGGTTYGRVDLGSTTAVPEPAIASLGAAAAAALAMLATQRRPERP